METACARNPGISRSIVTSCGFAGHDLKRRLTVGGFGDDLDVPIRFQCFAVRLSANVIDHDDVDHPRVYRQMLGGLEETARI